jgi:2-C-methyl-D-erythritol 4-phosphate cytidylyltransferase
VSRCIALIPAAGSGARLGGERPKQYLRLAGRPMLWHSLRAVCVPPLEAVFVVLAPGDTAFAAQDWSAFGGRVSPLYCGGATRHESVRNGLAAARLQRDDWVLVHDAARPCLPEEDLRLLMRECQDDPVGGLLALPAADTVKRSDADRRVVATEDRSRIWLAQTPQMFRAGLLGEALQRATGSVTDEAAAIEAMGLKPKLVAGSRRNIKVTFVEDVAIAEALLCAP